MGNRQRGDYHERQVRAALDARGYYTMRSAGSYGVFDVAAWKRGATPLLISCKVHGVISRADRRRLLDVAAACGARGLVSRRDVRGHVTFLAVLAADLTLVEVDRLKVPPRALRGDDPARTEVATT